MIVEGAAMVEGAIVEGAIVEEAIVVGAVDLFPHLIEKVISKLLLPVFCTTHYTILFVVFGLTFLVCISIFLLTSIIF